MWCVSYREGRVCVVCVVCVTLHRSHRRMKHEKVGMDSTAGWMGYLSKQGSYLNITSSD